ncbi:MAG: conjugal transfer protein TraI [Sphingomonas sp. 28-66-16]|nr:MAG: conjugal transfer protein TraI [Sphingomonas sp. 28-66-16]
MAENDGFEPRLGRIGNQGGKRTRRYLSRVLAASNLARGGAFSPRAKSGFSGGRMGRGAGVGRVLASRTSQAAFRQRRVIIKSRIVRLAGKGAAGAAAHLRYLQRDGTTREGAPGTLYGPDAETIDGKDFRERGAGDRHQFRFIVSAEDGAEYDDLKPLTRRLMERVEQDLGTRLDWVAVDHFNTGHPHTHIIVRGRDHLGADLVIARDYLTSGMRERAAELVDLDLGPRSIEALAQARRLEVGQERLTSIDRALLRGIGADGIVNQHHRDPIEQALRTGRLTKLSQLGLAEPVGAGRWRLADRIDETLRVMGERGDIIRTMQRDVTRAALDRPAPELAIYEPGHADARPLVGRVVSRGLADEHRDRHYLIVDATDGRSHYVAIGKGEAVAPLAPGAIVGIAPRRLEVRAVDRTIAVIAEAHDGRYDIDTHLRHDPSATEAFAQTHVRRLESLRRAGVGVVRDPTGVWAIAPDHLDRVAAHEQAQLRDRPVSVDLLSAQPLDRLVGAEAATWLDREAMATAPVPLRAAGFGHEVEAAQARRRQWLIGQGFAEEIGGVVSYRPDMLSSLQRSELLRVAGQLANELDRRFVETAPGERIEGIYRKPVELLSGRFALIEKSREFTLVPWRPVLDAQLGKPVGGIMRDSGISWTIGRGRSGPVIE